LLLLWCFHCWQHKLSNKQGVYICILAHMTPTPLRIRRKYEKIEKRRNWRRQGQTTPTAVDQWISGSVVEGAPTEEPRPDASNARSQRPATRAIVVSRAFACVLNTRGFPQVFYTAPVIHPVRVHINFPGRQVNAVWGRYPPTECTMYIKKEEALSVLGLVDKISPAFELRNSGVQPGAGPASPLRCQVCLWV
jgi:hypothetical protein